jgi:hypothetical protein
MLTGEEDFYLRIARAIGQFSADHQQAYQQAYDLKRNALLKIFMSNFVADDGNMDWNAIVRFNSSEAAKAKLNG